MQNWGLPRNQSRDRYNSVDPYWDNVVLLLRGEMGATENTIVDSSKSQNIATQTANMTMATLKKIGLRSVVTYGVEESGIAYNTNFLTGTEDYTVETWVLICGAPSSTPNPFIFRFADGTNNIAMRFNNSTRNLQLEGISTSVPVDIGVWQHLAGARKGNTLRFFKNGIQIGSETNTKNLGGANTAQISRFIAGLYNCVRITKGVCRYTTDFDPIKDTYLS